MNVICFDLDDTLYKEISYLKSAYREIAAFAAEHCHGGKNSVLMLAQKGYEVMMKAYLGGDDAFGTLNKFLGLNLPINAYLSMYRSHIPDIHLEKSIECFLSKLYNDGTVLGIITDGRMIQQQHKIKSLDLERFFKKENIVISEAFGSEKPCELNYSYFMERYPEAERYVYVGDNLRKDFVTPNRLGWLTIGLKDNGENIHSQDLDVEQEYYPQLWVDDLIPQLVDLLGVKASIDCIN